jgi:hypothetical protein
MTKTVLLASAAALALSIGGASAHPAPALHGKATASSKVVHWNKGVNRAASVLYDQNDDSQGYADVSQNFESSLDAYDAQAADDFVVPKGATWKVTEVDVSGLYFNGSGPANSLHVQFYKNKKGKPSGSPVADLDGLSYTDVGFGSFVIDLGKKGVKLKKGKYFVSVQANLNFSGGGEWGWSTRVDQAGKAPAQWQNPGDGFGTGCTTWAEEQTCLGGIGGIDHMFTLRGKSKG